MCLNSMKLIVILALNNYAIIFAEYMFNYDCYICYGEQSYGDLCVCVGNYRGLRIHLRYELS